MKIGKVYLILASTSIICFIFGIFSNIGYNHWVKPQIQKERQRQCRKEILNYKDVYSLYAWCAVSGTENTIYFQDVLDIKLKCCDEYVLIFVSKYLWHDDKYIIYENYESYKKGYSEVISKWKKYYKIKGEIK